MYYIYQIGSITNKSYKILKKNNVNHLQRFMNHCCFFNGDIKLNSNYHEVGHS